MHQSEDRPENPQRRCKTAGFLEKGDAALVALFHVGHFGLAESREVTVTSVPSITNWIPLRKKGSPILLRSPFQTENSLAARFFRHATISSIVSLPGG